MAYKVALRIHSPKGPAMIIKRVDVMSCGTVFAGTGLLVGLLHGLAGIVIALPVLVRVPSQAIFAVGIGLLAFPVLWAVGMFISGLLWACLYNFSASLFGGLKIDVVESPTDRARKRPDTLPEFDFPQ